MPKFNSAQHLAFLEHALTLSRIELEAKGCSEATIKERTADLESQVRFWTRHTKLFPNKKYDRAK